MKDIFKYLLFLILMVFISSTTVQIMTVKPAKPSNIFIKKYHWFDDMKSDIVNLTKKGWVVKSVATSNYTSGSSNFHLIMEKY